MRQHTQQPATELHGFCVTCPPAENVTALLAVLGFRLAFQMEAQDDLKKVGHPPALPAQYHYRDASGTEVLYLAGRDSALEGETLPAHSSRFWLYAGAQYEGFQCARSALALAFQFTWRSPGEPAAPQQEVA